MQPRLGRRLPRHRRGRRRRRRRQRRRVRRGRRRPRPGDPGTSPCWTWIPSRSRRADARAAAPLAAAGGDGGEATEAAADREFNFRLLALRQYTDTKRDYAGKGAKNQWNWRVHRTNPGRGQDLCGDVLKLMKGAKKQDVWRPTYMTFVAADGNEEDGEDSGGLTSEAHSVFWREVTAAPYARTELEPGTSRAVSTLPLTNGLCLGTGAAFSLMGCPSPTRPWRR